MLNPSFEDNACCPSTWHQTGCAPYWTTNINTWDYLHECGADVVSVPNNYAGHQWPSTGQAYAGFHAWGRDPVVPPYWPIELVGGTLAEPLVPGVEYDVSFAVSLASSELLKCCACDDLGILFVTQDHGTLNYSAVGRPPMVQGYAHVMNNSMITDSIGWTIISGRFVADSSYTHFLIGRFSLETIPEGNCWCSAQHPNNAAYYYLDDVSVVRATDTHLQDHPALGMGQVHMEWNPSTQMVLIDGPGLRDLRVLIVDAMGKILNGRPLSGGTEQVDLGGLAPGSYLVVVQSAHGVLGTCRAIVLRE